jgi:hypothetical protein
VAAGSSRAVGALGWGEESVLGSGAQGAKR